MDAIVGFVLGVIATAFGAALSQFGKLLSSSQNVKMLVSQSRTHAMLYSVMNDNSLPDLDTQATRFFDDNQFRVLYTEDNAYWIKDNSVYRARIENGMVNVDSEEKLDIFSMDKVELEEMIFIIEKLTEGKKNDRWNPGNEKF